jgi:hypothetical protein
LCAAQSIGPKRFTAAPYFFGIRKPLVVPLFPIELNLQTKGMYYYEKNNIKVETERSLKSLKID